MEQDNKRRAAARRAEGAGDSGLEAEVKRAAVAPSEAGSRDLVREERSAIIAAPGQTVRVLMFDDV